MLNRERRPLFLLPRVIGSTYPTLCLQQLLKLIPCSEYLCYERILAPAITVRGLLKRPISWAVGAKHHLFFRLVGSPTLIESRVPAIPSVIPTPALLCASLAPEFYNQTNSPFFPSFLGLRDRKLWATLCHDPPVCYLGWEPHLHNQ